MVEYIERETLYHRIRAFAADVIFRGCEAMLSAKDTCNPREWTRGYEQGVKDISTLIATQAAADVAPVVHARWIKKTGRAQCSYCADECWADSATEYNYCPNCGAKMDQEEA